MGLVRGQGRESYVTLAVNCIFILSMRYLHIPLPQIRRQTVFLLLLLLLNIVALARTHQNAVQHDKFFNYVVNEMQRSSMEDFELKKRVETLERELRRF